MKSLSQKINESFDIETIFKKYKLPHPTANPYGVQKITVGQKDYPIYHLWVIEKSFVLLNMSFKKNDIVYVTNTNQDYTNFNVVNIKTGEKITISNEVYSYSPSKDFTNYANKLIKR